MSCLGVTCGLSMFIIQPGHMEKCCLSWLYPRHPIRLSRAAVFVQSLVCAVYSSGLNISLSLIVVTPEKEWKDRTVKSTQNHSNWLFYLFWGFLIVFFFWVSRVVLIGHSEVTSQMWKFCGWKTCQMLVQLLLLRYKMEEYTETHMGVSENSVPHLPNG